MTPYLGEIRIFAGTYAPQDWMLCDGSALKVSEWQALFAVLGTIWGGDGVTTFRIPNLVGRLPVGQGQGPGLNARAIGQTGGEDAVALAAAVPAHSHAFFASVNPATSVNPGASVVYAQAQAGDVFYAADQAASAGLNPGAVANSGGGLPHQNQMASLSVNYIICVNGLFPVQQ